MERRRSVLPNAQQAEINASKVRDYVLSLEHETGRHKARVFASALGIDREHWRYLRDQIRAQVQHAQVSEVRAGQFGMRYSVPILVEGLNGQTHEVITAWIVEIDDARPRLTTAYVNVP